MFLFVEVLEVYDALFVYVAKGWACCVGAVFVEVVDDVVLSWDAASFDMHGSVSPVVDYVVGEV